MHWRLVLTGAFLAIGCFFVAVAAVGVVRMPDFYTRMHPAGKNDTLGQAMILLGLVVHEGLSLVSVKLLMVIVFIYIASPTATFAIAKAAHVAGVKPWARGEKRR
ncbi:MAG: monovalent cation/H(+) antiporter subunit G [Nitrospirota bacterium]|jgi:multicomponent Na+:H+ antiporter subunit G